MEDITAAKGMRCEFSAVTNWDELRQTYRTRYEFTLEGDGGLIISFNDRRILGGEGEDRIDRTRLGRGDICHDSAGHNVFLSTKGEGIRVKISEHGSKIGDFIIKPDGTILANREIHSSRGQATFRSLGVIKNEGCEITLYDPFPI